MNLSLTPELERPMEERDIRREEIRRRIAQSQAAQQTGRLTDGDAVFDRIGAELDALDD